MAEAYPIITDLKSLRQTFYASRRPLQFSTRWVVKQIDIYWTSQKRPSAKPAVLLITDNAIYLHFNHSCHEQIFYLAQSQIIPTIKKQFYGASKSHQLHRKADLCHQLILTPLQIQLVKKLFQLPERNFHDNQGVLLNPKQASSRRQNNNQYSPN